MSAIKFEKDADNIVTLTMDMPGQSANTMNDDYREAMSAHVKTLQSDIDNVAGIIITSAKKTFFAGGDLRELIKVTEEDAADIFAMTQGVKADLRALETLGKPVVAAINGAALGGGYEICLACHYRICLANSDIKLGLPESQLGLLPGGGGIVRMVRLLGLEKSLPFLLEAKQMNPQRALDKGLIDEVVTTKEDMITAAKAWIKANPTSQQPWDRPDYEIPGGIPGSPQLAELIPIAPAVMRQKTKGNYPAQDAIMSAAVESAQVDFESASRIEARYFTSLATGQIAKNIIGTLWFQLNDIKAGSSRPDGIERQTAKKVGVLGAGMMGSGIAYVTAMKNVETVLKDVSIEQAEKGKSYSAKLLDKKVSRGQIDEKQKQAVLNRILATDKAEDLAECDLIIEAVFEDRSLKAKVTQEAEPLLAKTGVFASNTSTLPITELAEASQDASKFIGLHFFSPVDKMPLVEIIKGKETSDETLAKAFDYVLQIGKTPIVVNDSRGFYTSRVFGTSAMEGVAMLAEGISPASIENGAMLAGMPVGPLAVLDEVSLSLVLKIEDQTRKDMEAAGKPHTPTPGQALVRQMVEEFGRSGKAAGAGFYEYPKNGKKHLWSELYQRYAKPAKEVDLQEIKDRILFIQSIETIRCYEEKVLESVADANIGSIFGIGFPPWTGGTLQFVNQYGLDKFVARATELAEKYGSHFAPPKLLLEKAKKGEIFE